MPSLGDEFPVLLGCRDTFYFYERLYQAQLSRGTYTTVVLVPVGGNKLSREERRAALASLIPERKEERQNSESEGMC